MNELPLVRMSGAGNTFFLVDGFEHPISEIESQKLTLEACRQTAGKETDGLFVLIPDGEVDFKWLFFNDDGSKPQMCGNAARCAALYWAKKSKFTKMKVRFRTSVGIIQGEVLTKSPDSSGNYLVKVELPKLADPGREIAIGDEKFFFINTGVPHLVVAENPDPIRGGLLRRAPELGVEGANVTFVDGNKAVSFERGVENFTQACGTGAIAAAAYLRQKNSGTKFQIQMPGGTLEVEWLDSVRAQLTGPTKFDFEMKFERKTL